jgi:hypothetical protein
MPIAVLRIPFCEKSLYGSLNTFLCKGSCMIPFVTLTDTRGQSISVNPEIVQFIRAADNAYDECLIVFGKDQLLRVRGTLDAVTQVLREG